MSEVKGMSAIGHILDGALVRSIPHNSPIAHIILRNTGCHPCVGMPLAKAVMKTIAAMFLLSFDYDLVDGKGETIVRLPPPNRDDLHKTPPVSPVCE